MPTYHIQQLYTACLSEAAYYIESDGEAAIIDPMRDIEPILELARSRSAQIRYILETHLHADFVSGHLDLQKATGAPILFGPGADIKYPVQTLSNHESLPLGQCSFTILHTPGHTLESTCYLFKDENKKDIALFSRDTLFVGDVGRPDLSSGSLSAEELAGMLYQSIQKQIMPLADDVILYPAHGPGSSCGKNLGPETFSTMGEQKKNNYALKAASEEDFIKQVTEGLAAAPAYFALNAQINQQGYEPLDQIKSKGLKPLSVAAFKELMQQDYVLIDTRHATLFTQGFVPGSIFLGLEGRYAEWAAQILPFDQPLILVTDPGKEEESLVRLCRVGFSKIEGFLEGGFEQWQSSGEPVDMIIDIEADELIMDLPYDPNLLVLDVRKESEFAAGHLEDAMNLPLAEMTDTARLAQFDDNQQIYIHCAGGYRSVIAASLLKRQGIQGIRNVLGGWKNIQLEKKAKIVKEKSI